MKSNNVQFAVVREDPEILIPVIKENQVEKALLICSAGCTSLTLRAVFPDLKIDLVDFNPHQIDLVKQKVDTIQLNDTKKIENLVGLNDSGNFESLFTSLRRFLFEFVLTYEDIKALILSNGEDEKGLSELFLHPYWDVAFKLFFSDSILNTMFTEEATQHADPDSYPGYFKSCFEDGLRKSDSSSNYFLHHVLLGHYLEGSEPRYFHEQLNQHKFVYTHGVLSDVKDLSKYDFIDLSNIFDWMSEDNSREIISLLQSELKIGCCIIFRQLNNEKNYQTIFGDQFLWDEDVSKQMTDQTRSLFYNQINCFKKNK